MDNKKKYKVASRLRRQGLSVKKSCERAGISGALYYYYEGRKKSKESSAVKKVSFVEHRVSPPEEPPMSDMTTFRPYLRVRLCNGVSVEFFEPVSEGDVSRIVGQLAGSR